MQEIYRSFEGKLNVDCQDGYIILELKERYQIEWLTVWGKTQKIRVKKDLLPVEDFGNTSKISELFTDISHGCHNIIKKSTTNFYLTFTSRSVMFNTTKPTELRKGQG